MSYFSEAQDELLSSDRPIFIGELSNDHKDSIIVELKDSLVSVYMQESSSNDTMIKLTKDQVKEFISILKVSIKELDKDLKV